MAIDTELKRRAVALVMPPPTGAINTEDERRAVAGVYPLAAVAACQVLALLQRMRQFHLDSLDILEWINTFDAAETTAGHVKLGFAPANVKVLRTKGPAIGITLPNHNAVNAGQQTSFNGTIDIAVRYLWYEDPLVESEHTAALKALCLTQNMLYKLDPFEPVFGGAIMDSSGPLFEPFDDGDELWIADVTYTVDYGPGGG